jgi:hypothetical protein
MGGEQYHDITILRAPLKSALNERQLVLFAGLCEQWEMKIGDPIFIDPANKLHGLVDSQNGSLSTCRIYQETPQSKQYIDFLVDITFDHAAKKSKVEG